MAALLVAEHRASTRRRKPGPAPQSTSSAATSSTEAATNDVASVENPGPDVATFAQIIATLFIALAIEGATFRVGGQQLESGRRRRPRTRSGRREYRTVLIVQSIASSICAFAFVVLTIDGVWLTDETGPIPPHWLGLANVVTIAAMAWLIAMLAFVKNPARVMLGDPPGDGDVGEAVVGDGRTPPARPTRVAFRARRPSTGTRRRPRA
jgi:hypothetical protein